MTSRILLPLALLLSTSVYSLQVYVGSYAANCTSGLGYATASASGGTAPYTFVWSDGSIGAEAYLPPGIYSVTATDNSGGFVTENFEIYPATAPLNGSLLLGNIFSERLEPCQGQCNGGFRLYLPLRLGGYSVSTTPNMQINELQPPFWQQANGFMLYEIIGACPGQNVSLTVDNDCGSGAATVTIPQALVDPEVTVVQLTGSCSNSSSGTISASATWEGLNPISSWSVRAVDELGNLLPLQSVDLFASPTAFQFFGLHPGNWFLRFTSIESEGSFQAPCIVDIPFVVPDLGPDCGTLTGRAFIDANENCIQNTGEPNLNQTVVVVQPGDHYALTSPSGQYSISLPYGTYTVTTASAVYQEHCGVSDTPFSLSTVVPNVVRDLADTSLVGLDVMVSAGSGAARVGFPMNMHIQLRNLTGVLAGNATVTLTYDPVLTYVSATPAPSTISGNTLTWNSANLGALQQRNFSIAFTVPPDIGLLGTVLNNAVSASVANPEADLSNNSFLHQVTVTSAYDPNDKTALTSSRLSNEVYYIADDEYIDYTIRFQNTGTDTAFLVVITDTLPPTLDPATFLNGAASHAHDVSLSGQGILRWNFPNILLPDSNVNEPRSHGFVSFRIRPRLPLLPGDEIENIANIYFDFNPPVITEPSVLVAEFSTGVEGSGTTSNRLQIHPNPAQQQVWIQVLDDSIAELELFSLDGRRVLQMGAWDRTIALDVSPFPAGAYMVRVRLSNGSFQHANLIKH